MLPDELVRFDCRVPADMALYDILNEFQKGSSHMAAVVKVRKKEKKLNPLDIPRKGGQKNITNGGSELTIPLLIDKQDEQPNSIVISMEKSQENGSATNNWNHDSPDIEEGEVMGIITLEDVFEELLQVIFIASSSSKCNISSLFPLIWLLRCRRKL